MEILLKRNEPLIKNEQFNLKNKYSILKVINFAEIHCGWGRAGSIWAWE